MPSFFSGSSHANNRLGSETNLFAPAPRFVTGSETARGQLIDSGARKRSRQDSEPNPFFTNPQTPTATGVVDGSITFSRFSDARSPPPLANDRYELAGGMERPAMITRYTGDYDDYSQLEKQRGMWSMPTSPASMLHNPQTNRPLPSVPNGATPWMLNQLLNIVGGVAGKLVQFCSVPFKGFHAGGGEGYTFASDGAVAPSVRQEDAFIEQPSAALQDPLPGEYPEDNYGVASIDSIDLERPRMAKRLRTGENWIMVDKDGDMESRPATPRLSERRVPDHASPSQIPRPVSRAGSTSATPKRPSLIPVSRRSTMDRRSFQKISKTTSDVHSSPRNYSRQSYGSPAMFKSESNTKTSPLPPESQRIINKLRREELEDDARLRRMSSQMSAMLREAQEALGTKIEMEDEVDEEPYSEQAAWYGR